MIRLGLIGANIKASRSPVLHVECGRLHGLEVRYDLLIPADLGLSFEQTFEAARAREMTGFNVTLPFKETVIGRLQVADPMIARIGSCNTVRLGRDGAPDQGFNTDYSGFMAAFRAGFDHDPGVAVLIGSGGVGKAVGFALAALQAREIRIVDTDAAKAGALARALRDAGAQALAAPDAATAMQGADGVLNCTPLGMHGYPGSPVSDAGCRGLKWGFDAVYTPEDTLFRAQVTAAGAAFLSGWELFFHQGIDAFEIFTGIKPEHLARLRARIRELAP